MSLSESMSVPFYQVDSFTTTPRTGNPAAVCVLSTARDADWMQAVAAEMNLSETAFVRPQANGTYRLRWFTPTAEVDLCGHATLASAHVLWSDGFLAPDAEARFDTQSGRLTASRNGEWMAMNFPADPPAPVEPPSGLLDALGVVDPRYVGKSERDFFVHCSAEEEVVRIDPDLNSLAGLDSRGVIVTASSDRTDADFVSRFFGPGVGVPEDPVTGSAHCALGPYWAKQTGQTSLTGRQVSARGGTVRTALGGPGADRVTLSGRAVTVIRGRLDT